MALQEEKIYQNLRYADCLYSEIDVDLNNPGATFMSSAMHSHNYNEICIVTEGNTKIITPKSITHQKGCFLIYYPAYLPHMQINSLTRGYKRYLIRFETGLANPALLSPIAKRFITGASDVLSVPIDKQNLDILLNSVELLGALCRHTEKPDGFYSRNLTLAVILNIISQIISSQDNSAINSGKYFYIGEVLSHISENFSQKLSADDIARQFFVSRAKLMTDFKRVTGETLTNYITKVRLENAVSLLSADIPLCDISERCGFSSVSYFISRFGKVYGVTPLQYKKGLSQA